MSPSRLSLFATLRALREFEKRHLPCIETIEDCDLLWEIGYRQAARRPITLKELMLLGVASVPTIQRRLRRLRQFGAIVQQRRADDRRSLELVLAPDMMRTIGLCEPLLRPTAGAADGRSRDAASAPKTGASRRMRSSASR
jgi:hypothetical protein